MRSMQAGVRNLAPDAHGSTQTRGKWLLLTRNEQRIQSPLDGGVAIPVSPPNGLSSYYLEMEQTSSVPVSCQTYSSDDNSKAASFTGD
jgi:hypothetical protein